MNTREKDMRMMKRALSLAANGEGFTSPNPMVGAVITDPQGSVIGEGWHRRFGGPHAEVNAVASVKDKSLLPGSTIYVTLEPCSHYGKTPPCAELIIRSGFRKVVIGAPDPNPLVAGRGISMIRDAGIEVTENVLRNECIDLNRRFMTAQIERRPWIQLKWAQSADGFIASAETDGNIKPVRFSTPVTTVLMHRERAMADAILVGTNTVITDNPSLTLRHYPGRSPRTVIFRSERISHDARIFHTDPIILDPEIPLVDNMKILFSDHNISSLMVEGGAQLLNSFIESALFDEIRIETSPHKCGKGILSPSLPHGIIMSDPTQIDGNIISVYRNIATNTKLHLQI